MPSCKGHALEVASEGLEGGGDGEGTEGDFFSFTHMPLRLPFWLLDNSEFRRGRRLAHTVSAGVDLATPMKQGDVPEVAEWSLTDVSKWLARIGLGRYKALFQSHSISGPALLRLTPGSYVFVFVNVCVCVCECVCLCL